MDAQPDLAELITQSKDRTGRSFSDLARDAGTDDHGVPVITKGRVQQLAGGDMSRWPSPSTIRGLARALHVTERAVILACARRFGFSVDESSVLENLLPTGLGFLTEADLAAIVGYVTHLVEIRRPVAPQPPPVRAGRSVRSHTGSEGRGKPGARKNTA